MKLIIGGACVNCEGERLCSISWLAVWRGTFGSDGPHSASQCVSLLGQSLPEHLRVDPKRLARRKAAMGC